MTVLRQMTCLLFQIGFSQRLSQRLNSSLLSKRPSAWGSQLKCLITVVRSGWALGLVRVGFLCQLWDSASIKLSLLKSLYGYWSTFVQEPFREHSRGNINNWQKTTKRNLVCMSIKHSVVWLECSIWIIVHYSTESSGHWNRGLLKWPGVEPITLFSHIFNPI